MGNETKCCKMCKEVKSVTDFYYCRTNADKLRGSCILCMGKENKSWYKANKPQRALSGKRYRMGATVKVRDTNLRKKYGITYNEYMDMLEKQGGVCLVCGLKSRERKVLCVDHCHASGVIRGLLCDRCNRVLGSVNDNMGLLLRMVQYLLKHRKVKT